MTKDKLSRLQDKVLLSPQWLADVMKKLMQIKQSQYDSKYAVSIHRLQKEGIVDGTLLSALWEKELKGEMEAILIFLQAYGLIIPVGLQPQQYYVPSQLPVKSEKMKTPTVDCSKVHISFGGFLPPFVLHHLMFKMYSDSQQSEECCFLATKGFIEPLHDCQWWVCQHNNDIIEVCIR